MIRSGLVALSAVVAFAAGAQSRPAERVSIFKQTEAFAQTCGEHMPFRAGVAILSEDPKRPSMMAMSVGNTNCLADPVPPIETAGHLAYLTAQLGPAHVLDQLQRTGRPRDLFEFPYKGTVFQMQLTAIRLDTEMLSVHPMICHDYNFVSKMGNGQLIASGEMQVCLPQHRLAANNLPVVPLAGASQGPRPEVRRSATEPRDSKYYDPDYKPGN